MSLSICRPCANPTTAAQGAPPGVFAGFHIHSEAGGPPTGTARARIQKASEDLSGLPVGADTLRAVSPHTL